MKITIELTGAADDLRKFLIAGIDRVGRKTSYGLCQELAGEVLEAAVKDGAAGITLGDRVQLSAPAQDHFPAIGVLGYVEDEVVHLAT